MSFDGIFDGNSSEQINSKCKPIQQPRDSSSVDPIFIQDIIFKDNHFEKMRTGFGKFWVLFGFFIFLGIFGDFEIFGIFEMFWIFYNFLGFFRI